MQLRPKQTISIFLAFALVLSGSLLFVFGSGIVQAARGVPEILNHQGRLLDEDGNLLGGSGTNFCFRFSIYDNATVGSGSRLWPSGTPSTMTVSVTNGVYNVGVGDTSASGDSLTFNFQDNDSVYLNIEVAEQSAGSCAGVSFENLSPRQRILAAGYAINAGSVLGENQSAIGTSTPVTGAVLTVRSTSTASIALAIRATASQTGNLLSITDSAASDLFIINSNGTLTSSGTGTSTFANGISISAGCFRDATGVCITAGGGGANTSLSNLSSVAVNASLTPGTNNSIDLGSYGFAWNELYASGTIFGNALTIAGTGTSTSNGGLSLTHLLSTGGLTITGSNTSTFTNGIQLSAGCFRMADGTCAGAGSSGANTSLSNLASVAVNASLTPGTNNSIDLGSYGFAWNELYASGTIFGNALTIAGTGTSTFAGGISTAGLSSSQGLTITGGGLINSSTATSTFANGIQLSAGCFRDASGACITAGGGGANTALSNLASVAINTSLLSDANNTDDLGSYDFAWRDIYASGTIYATSFGGTGTSTFNGGLSAIGLATSRGLAITGGSIANTSSATSTFANGIQLSAGCFRMADGTCAGSGSAGASGWTDAGAIVRLETAADQVVIGTTNPFGKAVLSVLATSTAATPLILQAAPSQTANLFEIQNDAGAALISVNSGGLLSLTRATTTRLSVTDRLYIGNSTTSTLVGDGATSTFSGGLSVSGGGGLASANGITISGGSLLNTSTATSTFSGAISSAGLSSSAGLVISGGSILHTSTATSTFSGGINVAGGGFRVATLGNCDSVDTDANGNLICGTDAGAGASPFGSSGGVITKSTASDRVELRYGDAGDVQLTIENTTAGTVPTTDAMQILLTGGSGITTNGVDGLYINIEGGNGVSQTVSALHLDFDQVSPTGDDTFQAITIDGVDATAASERAIQIGDGWDIVLDSESLDISGSGTISGAKDITANGTIRFSGYDCSGLAGGGTLTTTADGTLVCGADDGGSGAIWSSLTDPLANLSLNHNEFTTTFTWDTDATDSAFTGLTLAINNDDGTDSTLQRLLVIKNNSVSGGGITDRLLVLDNADGSAVTTALEIGSAPGGSITTAIDVSSSTIGTALAFGSNNIDGDFFDVTGSSGAVTAGLYNGQRINSAASFTGTIQAATHVSSTMFTGNGAVQYTASGTTPTVLIGANYINSITLQTDGAGNGEVVLPNESIGPTEILDNSLTGSDLQDDILDFSDFSDSMTIDSPTAIAFTATGASDPLIYNFTNNSSSADTQRAFQIVNAVTTQTTDVATEALLRLDNADTLATGSTVVTDALLISASGDITNAITDAIDASDGDILNALNVGANIITGTTFTISATTGNLTLDPTSTVLLGSGDSLQLQSGGNILLGSTGMLDMASAGALKIGINTATSIRIGSGTSTSITFSTDGTGDGEIVLPTDSIGAGEILDDSLDFSDFLDAMALDAGTTVSFGANNLTYNLTSTGDFVIQDNGTAFATFDDSGLTTINIASSTRISVFDRLFVGGTATTTILGNGSTSTFSGGLSVSSGGGLASANGLSITGGSILNTSTATSTFSGGLTLTSLTASQGIVVTGGSILNTSSATSSFTGGISTLSLASSNGLTITGGSILNSSTASSTFAGPLVLNGNVRLGDATTDTIDVQGRITGSLVPATNNTLDLGAFGNAFRDIYASGTFRTGSISITGTATTTFLGGLSVGGGGLASSAGLSITGGSILNTSSATSSFTGGISTLSLASSNGLAITGGSILNTSSATSSFTGGISLGGGGLASTAGLTVTGGALQINSGLIASTGNITIDPTSSIILGSNDTLRLQGQGNLLLGTGMLDVFSAGELKLGINTATSITIGSGTSTAITLATDGTGNGEIVLPSESIGAAEIENNSLTGADITDDTLDWSDFTDAMTIDAATTIASTITGKSLDLNLSAAGTAFTPIALEITLNQQIDPTDQTLTGLNLNGDTNGNTDAGDTLQGLNIEAITGTAATENAIVIGSGWDRAIIAQTTIDTQGVYEAGGSNITLTNSDGYILAAAIAANSITGDQLAASVAGDGLVLNTATSPDQIDLDEIDVSDGAGITNSNSGFEYGGTGGTQVGLLQGCSDGQVLKWDDTSAIWQCQADLSGGSPALHTITAALANGDAQDSNSNTVQWNWDFTGAAGTDDSGLIISESTASTAGDQDKKALLEIITLSGSTASPLQITSASADVGDIWIDLTSEGDMQIRDSGTGFATFDGNGSITFAPTGASDLTIEVDSNSNLQIIATSTPAVDFVSISNTGQGVTASDVDALSLNFIQADDSDSTDVNSILKIDWTSSSGDADTLYGINVASSTGGSANERALNIGSGWDANIFFDDTSVQIQILDGGMVTFEDVSGNDMLSIADVSTPSDHTFTIDSDTDVRIIGGADNTDAFVITAGDILVSDGDLDLSGGDFNVTLDAGDSANITSAAAATADGLTITHTGVGNDALQITFTQNDDADSTDTTAGITITGTSSSGDQDQFLGIDITNLTDGGASSTAIQIGSGYDANLLFNDTSTLVQVAESGTITFEDRNGNDIFEINDVSNAASHTLRVDSDTGFIISGGTDSTIDISTGSNESLVIGPNGTGDVIIDTDANTTLTLNGGGDGVDSLVLTDGDILVSDGDLDLLGGDFNVTLDAGDSANITTNAAATADGLVITATAAENDGQEIGFTLVNDGNADSVAALNISVTSANTLDADTLRGINIGDLTSASADVIERAVQIGANWDSNLFFADTTTQIQISDGGTYTFEDANGNDILALADVSTSSNHILTGDADTGLVLSGMTTDITTNTNEDLTLTANGTGDVVLSLDTDTPLVFSQSSGGTDITTGTNESLLIFPNGTGDFFVGVDADSNVQIVATSTAPAVDMVSISNSGLGITTTGIDGMSIAFTQADDADATDTNAGLNITITGDSGDRDDILGILISNLAGSSAAASSTALRIGTGWDHELEFQNTTSSVKFADKGAIQFFSTATTTSLFTIKDRNDVGIINLAAKATTGNPATCEVGDIYINDIDNTALVCTSANTWEQMDNPDAGRGAESGAVALTTTEFRSVSATTTPSVAGNEMWIVGTGEFTSAAVHTGGYDMRIRKGGSACAGTQIGSTLSEVVTTSDTETTTISVVDNTATSTVAVTYNLCAAESGAAPDVTINDRTIVAYEISKDVGADLAEVYYSADTTLKPAEVISIDGEIRAGVQRSAKAYESDLLGVVSTRPGQVFSDGSDAATPVLVALSGRVPVKTSKINGEIKPGDWLTSSNIPGVAMKATKAGPVLGQALTKVEGKSEIGVVLMYVKPGWYNGAPLDQLLSGLTFESGEAHLDFGKEVLKQFVRESQVAASSTKSDLFADRLAAELEIITPKITAQDITVDTLIAQRIIASQIEGFNDSTATTTALSAEVESLTASLGALHTEFGEQEAQIDLLISKDAELEDKLNLNTQTVSALTMEVEALSGRLAFLENYFDLNFTDALKVTKGLRVDGPAIFDGGVRVDSIGAINTAIALLSDTLFIGRPYFNADTAGFAVIEKGAQSVEVKFETEYLDQPVVTASLSLEDVEDKNLLAEFENQIFANGINYIVTGKSTKGFTIRLDKPAPQDLKFSWIALAVKDAKTFLSNPQTSILNTQNSIDGGGSQSIENIDGGAPPEEPSFEEPAPEEEQVSEEPQTSPAEEEPIAEAAPSEASGEGSDLPAVESTEEESEPITLVPEPASEPESEPPPESPPNEPVAEEPPPDT